MERMRKERQRRSDHPLNARHRQIVERARLQGNPQQMPVIRPVGDGLSPRRARPPPSGNLSDAMPRHTRGLPDETKLFRTHKNPKLEPTMKTKILR